MSVSLFQPGLVSFLLVCIATITSVDGDSIRADAKSPRDVAPITTFSFGDVYRGEIISQIFVIRNEGDSDLEIKDFKTSCGCEVTSADKVIAPGKDGIATLEVTTESMAGEISRSATLHTNDPEHPAIVFTLNANVLSGASIRRGKFIGPIFISPGARLALFSAPGKKVTTEFSVTSEDAPVKILRVEGGEKHVAARIDTVEVGRNYKVVVESLPLDDAGFYVDRLKVITDSPSLPAFTIEVSLRIYPKQ